MKKNILTFLFTMILVLTLTGCSNKKSIDVSTFKEKLESNDYTVTALESINYEDVKDAATAIKDDITYSFFVFEDTTSAKNYYLDLRDDLIDSLTTTTQKKEESRDNYSKITIKNKTDYLIASRIGKTVLYIEAAASDKESVDKILDSIGY